MSLGGTCLLKDDRLQSRKASQDFCIAVERRGRVCLSLGPSQEVAGCATSSAIRAWLNPIAFQLFGPT